MNEKLYNVGKIVNTHGVRGEVKIVSLTDFPEIRFKKGSSLVLLDPEEKQRAHVEVETGRPQKNMFIVKFAGLDEISLVEKYKGWSVKVGEEDLVELEEGEYYFHEIVGCRVMTEDGQELGIVSEILAPGANDVWVVKRPTGKPAYIPVIDDVLLNVDVPSKTITIRLMEGLIDE